MIRKIADSILQRLLKRLTEALHEAAMDAVSGMVRSFLKRLALALTGTFLAAFGILFLCLGLVRFLTLLLQEWLAWTIVGLLTTVLGVAILLVSMPRGKH